MSHNVHKTMCVGRIPENIVFCVMTLCSYAKWFHNLYDHNPNFNHSENLTTHVQREL